MGIKRCYYPCRKYKVKINDMSHSQPVPWLSSLCLCVCLYTEAISVVLFMFLLSLPLCAGILWRAQGKQPRVSLPVQVEAAGTLRCRYSGLCEHGRGHRPAWQLWEEWHW